MLKSISLLGKTRQQRDYEDSDTTWNSESVEVVSHIEDPGQTESGLKGKTLVGMIGIEACKLFDLSQTVKDRVVVSIHQLSSLSGVAVSAEVRLKSL